MQDIKLKKAFCPVCRNNDTRKRKRAPGHYCFTCKVVFREPLVKKTGTEVV